MPTEPTHADLADGEDDDREHPLRAPADRMPARSRSGPSGKHANDRRKLTASDEQWALWDQAVTASGSASWAEWARERLTAAAAADLGIDPDDVTDD